MDTDLSTLSQETLHRVLLARVGRLRGYVDRRIPSRLRSTISADDVLQEVWLAAYRTVSTFTPDGPDAVDRWLTTIAKSKIVNAIRTARRSKRGGDRRCVRGVHANRSSYTDLFARIQSPQTTPSSEVRMAESVHAVSIALNHLRRDRRLAVFMRHIEGCSVKKIARAMRKTEPAVNSLVYQGLADLRSLLGDATEYFSDIQSPEAE